MKKKLLALGMVFMCALSFVGCGVKRSGQYKLDIEKQVTSLCDYGTLDLTLTQDYEVKDEQVEEAFNNILAELATKEYTEITDRTTVQEGDFVKVDYTGYKDGEAFEGGAAVDAMLDVSNNSDADHGYGFIEGFCNDLFGANVGDTVSSNMTFPADYSNSDLAGAAVTFEFVIKGIYSATEVSYTAENVTDQYIYDNLNEYFQVSTVDELREYILTNLTQSAEYYKYQAQVEAVKNYFIENSKVEIPKKYMELRLKEYEEAYIEDYCQGKTLEAYANDNLTMTVDELRDYWKENLEKQIKVEFIFGVVAKKEKLEIDEDDYKKYIDSILNSQSSSFEDETALYEYYGRGEAKEGEAYLRDQYLVNKAIDKMVSKANFKLEVAE